MAENSHCSVILVLTDLRLSLCCADADKLNKGVRIPDAVMRPYGAKTAGIPVLFGCKVATGAFEHSLGCTALWRRKHGD
jgi:hypothetical protein